MNISELKKDAKIKLSNSYGKAILIILLYVIINVVFELISKLINISILKIIYSIFILIITLPFSFGLTACIIKISRKEEVSPFDFINIGLQNIKNVWKVYGRTLLKLLLPIILVIITSASLVVLLLANIFSITIANTDISILVLINLIALSLSMLYLFSKSLYYVLTTYVLFDNPNATGLDIVNKSAQLMQNNRINYIVLNLSFIGWYLLFSLLSILVNIILPISSNLILGIAFLILSPYISVSLVNFYEELENNSQPLKEENAENNEIINE